MKHIYLLNLEDCFLSSEDYLIEENRIFFKDNTETKTTIYPSLNLNAIKNFKEFLIKNKQIEIMFTSVRHDFQLDKVWWINLFKKYNINIPISENHILIYSKIVQDYMLECKKLIKENNGNVKILDSFCLEILKQREKSDISLLNYEKKYCLYLGKKKRKSVIPINEYNAYECMVKTDGLFKDCVIQIKRNETFNIGLLN